MELKYQTGGLLIAPPAIPDPRFKRSVIIITHKFKGGTYGLCVNRPTNYSIRDVLTDTGIEANFNFPIYWGGPINPTTVWMLHSSEWKMEGTVSIDHQWSITSNIGMFYHLNDLDIPKQFRMFFGQCSWAEGQLEAELRGISPWNPNHSWLLAESPDPDWLFEQSENDLWFNCTDLSSHQAVDTWL